MTKAILEKIPKIEDLLYFSKAYKEGLIKINISKLARELNKDFKTVKRYLNGEIPKKTRKRVKYLDEHRDYMVAEQIRIVESLNILGVSKFSSRHIFGSHLEKAFEGLNRDYIVLPTTTKERLFNAYIENLKEKTLGYYIDRTNDPNFNHLIDSINSFTEEMTIEDKMIELLNIINLTENETIKERLITEHNRTVKYMIK